MRSLRFRNVVAGLLLTFAGCQPGLETEYGPSSGVYASSSLNGFGALRKTFETAGFQTRSISRFSPRAMSADAIVCIPTYVNRIDGESHDWLDRWLGQGGRTLVYVERDSGSEADYWSDAAMFAPPIQRLEYRRRAAKSINDRLQRRMYQEGTKADDWFTTESLIQREPFEPVSKRWPELVTKNAQSTLETEFYVQPFAAGTAATRPVTGPVSVSAPAPITVPTSVTTKSKSPAKFDTLVANVAGDTVVAEITSDNWKDSRIIVVASGSLLTNYAFTHPLNVALAAKVVSVATPKQIDRPTVGFLSNVESIIVTDANPNGSKASGMELLTVWPLSMATVHGIMLGIVACLMLIPIFGRPKKIKHTTESDFGDHLDAVAALMNKAGGEAFARARISDYMRCIHGETSGPWIIERPPHISATVTTSVDTLPNQPINDPPPASSTTKAES